MDCAEVCELFRVVTNRRAQHTGRMCGGVWRGVWVTQAEVLLHWRRLRCDLSYRTGIA